MGENSKIGWTHHTFTVVRGCRYAVLSDGSASPACSDGTSKPKCYAEAMSRRNPKVLGEWGATANRVFASEAYWLLPEKWNRLAQAAGKQHRVFCDSLGDIFEGRDVNGVESRTEVRPDYLPMLDRLFNLIVMTPWLHWLLLTKRPHLMAAWWAQKEAEARADGCEAFWPGNAWAGTTTENQAAANERIPHLLRVPARVRFLSCEPLLGAIDLDPATCQYCGLGRGDVVPPDADGVWWCRECESEAGFGAILDACADARQRGVNWVIAGCESDGPRLGSRRTDPAWIRSIRDHCQEAGVPLFLKQMDVGGKLTHAPELDGRAWTEVPS